VWAGRPSVSVFYFLYGIISLIAIAVLVGLELSFSGSKIGRFVFPKVVAGAGFRIPYPVEIVTIVIVLLAYLSQIIRLALLRARNKYVLCEDGLYVDHGILNLQNTFVAPMAFSDARLSMPITLRLLRRGDIVVDTNDSRHFKLLLLEDAMNVQGLIRRTLGHPVVRLESPAAATSPPPLKDEQKT